MTRALPHALGDDGYPLAFRAWVPSVEPRATLVVTHGLLSHSAWLAPLAERLASQHLVFGADRRGAGLDDDLGSDAPSAESLLHDLLDTARTAVESGPPRPLFLVGWCWGATLALHGALALGARPELLPRGAPLAGLALIAPCVFPSGAALEALERRRAESGDRAGRRHDPIDDTLFTRPAFEAVIQKDPRRQRELTPRLARIVERLSLDAAALLETLTTPTLVVLAGDDEAVDNERTVAAFTRRPRARVEILTLPGPHALQLEDPEALAAAIGEWIEQRLARAEP